ncbi:MAG: DUF285 domain-containing protein [Erysipelotrichaceae bacterium]|nr:DUF285 domain-containing protein [Erysipelotrichaceae bacterium]
MTSLFKCICCLLFILSPAPCENSYIIEIPQSIDLTQTDSFQIRIIENNMSENETLHITLPDSFTLSDEHGHTDIEGSVVNDHFEIGNGDFETRTVNCEIETIPVGQWHGQLDIHLELERRIPSNLLIKGSDLDQILLEIDPLTITFSDQPISEEYFYEDVSLAKDGSIGLYLIGNDVFISNASDQPIIANEDMAHAFQGLTHLNSICTMDHLDLSICKDMSAMFADTRSLSVIEDIEDLDTSSVTDMSFLFSDTKSLQDLDLDLWDLAAVSDTSHMFEGSSIQTLSIGNWNTSSVKDMSFMFSGCSDLAMLNISGWDTGLVEDMSSMFAFCSKLKSLSLSGWNVSSCQSFDSLFDHCSIMSTTGDLSAWNCRSCTSFKKMFSNCGKLRNIGDLSAWETGNVSDMSSMFEGCMKLKTPGDLSNWDVSSVTTFAKLFANTAEMTGFGDLSIWNVSDRCEDLSGMFQNCFLALSQDVDLHAWNVSNVTDISHMFENVTSMSTLNISGWDTGKVEDASSMFACTQNNMLSPLHTICGIEGLDVSDLSNISHIFHGQQYLNADLSEWDTQHLQDISYAFYSCYRFDINKLKHWNVSSVSDMNEAFGDHAGSFISSEVPDWYH